MNKINKDPIPYSMDELKIMAKRLRLTSLIEHAAELSLDEDSCNWSIHQWLGVLLSTEIERRDEVALARRLQEANLEFADACYPRIDKDPARQLDMTTVNNLFSLDWVKRKQNCINHQRGFLLFLRIAPLTAPSPAPHPS